jgi:hypothetical protein
MRILLLAILLALVGCDELSSYDDPRDWGDSSSTGTCTGLATGCQDRPASACTNGCETVTGCYATATWRCPQLRLHDSCEQADGCRWSVDHCEVVASVGCVSHGDRFSCENDATEDCAWGQACRGYVDPCSEAYREATCGLGCEWQPD